MVINIATVMSLAVYHLVEPQKKNATRADFIDLFIFKTVVKQFQIHRL